jgi:hypothetical protein
VPIFLSQCGTPDLTSNQTTGKIIRLYIAMFIFLDSKLEDKYSHIKVAGVLWV